MAHSEFGEDGVTIEINWSAGRLVSDGEDKALLSLAYAIQPLGIASYSMASLSGVYTIMGVMGDARIWGQKYHYDPGLIIGAINVPGWWNVAELSHFQKINQWLTRNTELYDITTLDIVWAEAP